LQGIDPWGLQVPVPSSNFGISERTYIRL